MTRIEEIEARLEIGYEVPCGIPLAVRDVDYLIAEVKRMREALEAVKTHTKSMRESQKLVGPPEYQGRPELMRAWVRTRYHAGKEIYEVVRDALKGAQS